MVVQKRIAAKQKQVADEKAKYDTRLKEAMQDIGTTESGIFLLKHLRKFCGFGEPNTIVSTMTGEVNIQGTLLNNQYEEVYKSLRKYMSKKTKIRVELND